MENETHIHRDNNTNTIFLETVGQGFGGSYILSAAWLPRAAQWSDVTTLEVYSLTEGRPVDMEDPREFAAACEILRAHLVARDRAFLGPIGAVA